MTTLPSFSEMLAELRKLEEHGRTLPALRIAWLRNITIDMVVPYVQYLGQLSGWRVEPYMGAFDNPMQEVIDDRSSFHQFAPHFVIICLKLELLSPRLVEQFAGLTSEERETEANRVIGLVSTLLTELRRRMPSPVLLHTFETPLHPSHGVLDWQDPDKQLHTIRRLNARLLDAARAAGDAYLVDLDQLRAEAGQASWFDHRQWYLGLAPYSRVACRLLADRYLRFFHALHGKSRKCLVLDCDNTLWGGIVGEEGLAGIQIGNTYPGSAFVRFQKAILDCHARGVLLALCSRNNEADVLEVLEKHPDMLLRETHFAARRINWDDKVTNLRAIASELNLGLDSVVFMDDSAHEIEMVRRLLPEVTAVLLPEDPSCYAQILAGGGWFDVLAVTEEDRQRTEMIRTDILRERFREEQHTIDLERYLQSLEMVVTISTPTDLQLSRVAQLSQRTNQFNLTTRRYSEAEIRHLVSDDSTDVLVIALRDRFGDMGLVGTAILRYAGDDASIEALLLSCRALARGVENALLAACYRRAQRRHCITLTGKFISTAKNAQVANFYETRGFRPLDSSADGMIYRLDIGSTSVTFPSHFKAVELDAPTAAR